MENSSSPSDERMQAIELQARSLTLAEVVISARAATAGARYDSTLAGFA